MKKTELLLMILQVPIDIVLLFFAAVSAYYLRFSSWATSLKPVMFSITFYEFLLISLLVILVWIWVLALLGLYSPDQNRKFTQDVTKGFSAGLITVGLVAMYIVFAQKPFDSRFLIVVAWFAGFFYFLVGRIFVRFLRRLLNHFGIGLRRVVIIGGDLVADDLSKTFKSNKSLGYNVIKYFKSFDKSDISLLKKYNIDEMIFTDIKNKKLAIPLVEYCNETHVTFKYVADLLGTYYGRVSMYPVGGVPLAELRPTSLDGWGKVVKRLFDISFAVLALLVTLPITLMTSLIIFIETGLPVIYLNERVGVRGEKFFLYKFRSMYKKDSTGKQFGKSGEEALKREERLIKRKNTRKGPIYKIADDPRVTPFGRLIRRWSVDELPQFLNVLGGSMSVVGPRPHQLREVQKYRNSDRRVFLIKPGITGLAQISGRSDLSFEEEMRLDALYIKNWNLLTDVIIILKTPFAVLRGRKVE